MKFEDLPVKQQLLTYMKITFDHNPNAIFCTNNLKYQVAAKDLINEGLLIEVVNPPGENDIALALTDAGKKYLNIVS